MDSRIFAQAIWVAPASSCTFIANEAASPVPDAGDSDTIVGAGCDGGVIMTSAVAVKEGFAFSRAATVPTGYPPPEYGAV